MPLSSTPADGGHLRVRGGTVGMRALTGSWDGASPRARRNPDGGLDRVGRAGASPRARRNPRLRIAQPPRHGCISACAGNFQEDGTRTLMLGCISACAEEPGRSPRRRRESLGASSACAEEPLTSRRRWCSGGVHLRVRGGTERRQNLVELRRGASPRARRNQGTVVARIFPSGCISACARRNRDPLALCIPQRRCVSACAEEPRACRAL